MQTYQTVADIIDFIETYHRQLKDFYRDHRDSTDSERLKTLLSYISRHEKNIQNVLNHIQKKDQDIILKTWVQFVPFTETILPRNQLTDPDPDLDNLVQQVFELDNNLIEFYNKMIHHSGIGEPVKEFFQHLTTLEEKEKTKVAEAARQIKNL
jgi:hypothetical protein